jgi:hypothetical protein
LLAPIPLLAPILQHLRYFFSDVITDFMVEGTVFRVHRYFLDRECSNFPRTTNRADGMIELEGVTKLEFESLLDLFYEGKPNEKFLPLDAWIAILSISTRYQMEVVRAHSIDQINNFVPRIDPTKQVVLARKCDVPEWLSGAYTALCQRKEPISPEEGRELGIETMAQLSEIRERLRDTFIQNTWGLRTYEIAEVELTVNEVFWPRPPTPPIPPIPFPPSPNPEQQDKDEDKEALLRKKSMKRKNKKPSQAPPVMISA